MENDVNITSKSNPDPIVRGMDPDLGPAADPDPDPSILTSESNPDPLVRGMDPDPDPAADPDLDPSIIMEK